jgi:hypothetical protein
MQNSDVTKAPHTYGDRGWPIDGKYYSPWCASLLSRQHRKRTTTAHLRNWDRYRFRFLGKINDQNYQTAISDFFGEGYHAAGARLLSVIEAVQGKAGVLRVMDDPRRLLTAYNECASKTNDPFRFDAQLPTALERLGMSNR